MAADNLMLAVAEGLKKRKPPGADMADDAPDSERGEGAPAGDEREHLEQIAGDFIDAIKAGDKGAVADLFREAFECCSTYPEDEAGPESE